MNTYLNIQIRVLAAQAQKQLGAVAGEIRTVEKASQSAATGMNSFMGSLNPKRMVAWGSQVQWTGRQLMRNFTLPLALAGGAATKFALDNEAAFVRIQKVYGDTSMSQKTMQAETNALRKTFEALSNQFGVNQSEVLKVAGDWAAAGASGVALAKATKLTLQTMILGEMGAADATQALISIQAQYGQQIGEIGDKHKQAANGAKTLADTIGILNMVENQTGTSMADLITSMSRSAGAARVTGVTIQQLAAYTAALVPAAGSAATAGNALKTIFSRILAPTEEAHKILGALNIKVADTAWQSKTATQRLDVLAHKIVDLTKGNKGLISTQTAVVASVIGSRQQFNKFVTLMQAIVNKHGYLQKAMNSSGSDARNFKQAQQELNQVLQSSPHRLKQMGVILQNSLAKVLQPLLPVIVGVAAEFAKLAQKFANMNPLVQKFILAGLALIAILGPVLIFVGSMSSALGEWAKILRVVTGPLFGIGKGIRYIALSPFKLINKGFGTVVGGTKLMISSLGMGLLKIKQFIAFSTYAGGVQGLLAGKIAAAYNFIKISIAANLAVVRGVMVATWATGMAKSVAIVEAGLAKISTQFAIRLTGELLTDLKRFWAVTIGTWVRGLSALWTVDMFGWVRIQANRVKSWVALALIDVAGWAASLVEWTTNAARKVFIDSASNLRVVANRAKSWVLLKIVDAAGWAASIATWTVGGAKQLVIDAVTRTRIFANRVISWVALRAVEAAGFAALLVEQAVFGAKSLALWAVNGVKTVGMAIVTSTAVTTVWRKMWLFMASPALILRGLASMGSALLAFVPTVMRIGKVIALAFTGPWGIAFLAILALAAAFHKQLSHIWENLKKAFSGKGVFEGPAKALAKAWDNAVGAVKRAVNSLPSSVANALIAVWKIVVMVAQKVYEAFSYLNPFAHHSPSLVENVTKGMSVIVSQYKRAGAIGDAFRKATADLQNFGKAVGGLTENKFARERADVAKAKPSALPSFDALVGDLNKLNPIMKQQKDAVDAQQQVVDAWSAKLDAANTILDTQQKILDGLKSHLDALTTSYDAHKQAAQDFANAPLQGMQAMSDAIFENDQAQKKLQLQMMQMDAAGQGIDDITKKMAMLAGSIESAKGDAKDLQQAGAGSDVLGPLNQQIDQMQSAYDSLNKTAQNNPMSDMQKQLDMLQQQGQMLQLQQSINFDPLTRQLDQMANAQKEISYADAVAGITAEKGAMAALEPQIAAATAAASKQQAVVDAVTAARDRLSNAYDAESKKLDKLKKDYQETADLISSIEQALRDAGQAAYDSTNSKKLSPAEQNFADAAGASFPDPGGNNAALGREAGNQVSLIDQMTKDSQAALESSFGKIDILGPIKKKWHEATSWISKNVGPIASPLKSIGAHLFDGMPSVSNWLDKQLGIDKIEVDVDRAGSGVGHTFGTSLQKSLLDMSFMDKVWAFLKIKLKPVTDFFQSAVGKIKGVWRLLAPDVKRIIDNLVKSFQHATKKLGPELGKWVKLIGPFVKALVKVVGFLLARFVPIIKIAFSVLGHTIGPILNLIIDVVTRVLQAFRGVVEIFTGIVNGDWKMALNGLKDLFVGTFGAIWSLITGIVNVIWGVVKGLVGGIVGFFKWLWDELVGHSIVPDIVNGIIWYFKLLVAVPVWIFNNIVKPIWNFFKWLWNNALKPVLGIIIKGIRAEWRGLVTIVSWIWNNILKPIWNLFKDVWNNYIWPAIKLMIKGIRAEWNGLVTIGTWIWNNILKPVVDVFKGLWNAVIPHVQTFASKIGSIFNGIGTAITAGINLGIDAINGLIGGLNWIGSHVPGLKFHIDTIQHIGGTAKAAANSIGATQVVGHNAVLATGGFIPQQVGAGFKTNGPRAIVGEGRKGYPEYVIPTDPRYRRNALELLYAAASDVASGTRGNRSGLPGGQDGHFALGGLPDPIPDIKGAVSSVVGGVRKAAIIAAFAVPLKIADAAIGKMPNGMHQRDMMNQKKNDIYNWAKGQGKATGGIIGRTGIPRRRVSATGRGVSAMIFGGDTYHKTIHFHGNLEFPNVKSGDDAEDLINSLENLVA